MREIPGQEDTSGVVNGFCAEAFVLDRDLLNKVAEAIGVELPETEPHKRLLEEIALRRGYGTHPGIDDPTLGAMQSALTEHEERLAALGSCV